MERKSEMPDRIEAEKGGEGKLPVEDDLEAVEDSTSLPDGGEGQGADGSDKKSGRLPGGRIFLLLYSVFLCALLATVGLYLFKLHESKLSSPPPATGELITRITRPVPQPDCKEMLDFLIVYQVQGRAVITALRMEAVFQSLVKHASFEKEPVVFRETVYDFLLRQNAPDETAKSWRSVFAQNLLDYLRVKLPGSCPDSIRLTQVENL